MTIITVQSYTEAGEVHLPFFQLNLSIQGNTGIYTDIAKINYIIEYFSKMEDTYVHVRNDGLYPRLTVEETFHYFSGLYGTNKLTQQLCSDFGFQQKRKSKVNNLSISEQQTLNLIKPYLSHHKFIVLEEPLQNLEEQARKIALHLFSEMIESGKQLIIISNNLEDLIASCCEISRLDAQGLHLLDFKEEKAPIQMEATTQLKIEKIPTKKNETIFLFNPPEIDYIESVEGEVVVYVAAEAYPCPLTLNDLERKLAPFGFFRCHRSYIVNLQKVREIITWTRNSYSLALHGQEKMVVPLSRNKMTELKEIVGI